MRIMQNVNRKICIDTDCESLATGLHICNTNIPCQCTIDTYAYYGNVEPPCRLRDQDSRLKRGKLFFRFNVEFPSHVNSFDLAMLAFIYDVDIIGHLKPFESERVYVVTVSYMSCLHISLLANCS